MKKFTSLIFAVICIAIMIGSWVWFLYASSGPGSYGIGLVPPMILPTIGLFIAAIILIGEFFKSLKAEYSLKAAASPNELPAEKNYKALAGAVVQIAIIATIVIWNVFNTFAIIFSLPAIAIIIGLSQGADLCFTIFRGKPIGFAPPQQPQNPVPNTIDEPQQQFNTEKYFEAYGTKNYRALVGAILRFVAIVGMWIYFKWIDRHTTGMGSLGIIVLLPFVLAFSAVLFAGAVLRISDYILSVKWASGYATESTPLVKSRRNPKSIAVQSVLIFLAAGVLIGMIGFLPSLAIIVVFVILKLVDE